MLETTEEYNLVNTRFPHIGEKLRWTWGHKECVEYIFRILNDSRDGARQGMPKDIASALFKLSLIHDENFPRETSSNKWDDNYYN